MNIDILEAEQSDLEVILQLQKDCYLTEAEIYNDYEIQPLKQDINSLVNEFKHCTILKAVINGEIIGSVRGYIENNTSYIGKLIVKREYQNKGIGRLLLDSMESVFNCNRFELFTGLKSEKNLHLYTKQGYTEFKRQYIDDNLTLIYLEKRK
ncbi:MAG TPA: GNAT family N-acetyltransferase [Draconibacterium sp.]|nr:GNAT family N-acetyltransferase [Draconibacterium sp.]